MSDSFIGRLLFKKMNKAVRIMIKGPEEENPITAMIESMLKEVPQRNLLLISNGAFNAIDILGKSVKKYP